jgi:hypothetical protein
MGSVVGWLARVGGDASLRYATAETLALALHEDDLGEDVREPLGARDADALRAVMGQGIYFSSQMPDGPDHEEDEPLDDGEEDDEDGTGKKKPGPFGRKPLGSGS